MGAQARRPFPEAEQAALGVLRCSSCSFWGTRCCDQTEGHALSLGVASAHFSLSCIGEGNGNPLQCSCLENPGDGGAWCAAVYGVAELAMTEAT